MSSSIRSSGISGEAVTNAENELSKLVETLNRQRQKINEALKCYQTADKAISPLEMQLAKGEKEVASLPKQYIVVTGKTSNWGIFMTNLVFLHVESLRSQQYYLEKQLETLKAASEPVDDEVDRLKELKKIRSDEEKELDRLTQGSKQLKEKTLSSLALVFALHHYKPTPLYVMDEIDAALDFKNVSIVGHYVKDRTKDVQFIIISLRNNMFELADRLVGIYKTDNCTKNITINPGSFQVLGKAA